MPIRVLQIVTQMHRGGLESRLMDIYRHIDRDTVQFDFFTFRKEAGYFDNEILSLGGRIFYNPPISIRNLPNLSSDFARFLLQHPEYKIVHAHMNAWCGILLKGAAKAGIPIRIAHSRIARPPLALNSSGLETLAKNIIKLPVNRYATHRFAVSRKAGVWLYGQKAMDHGLVDVWPNAIECTKFSYNPVVRQEVRNELDLGSDYILIHVGNRIYKKNHIFLLRVFAEMLQLEPHAKLVMVGGGDWDIVQQEVQKLGVADRIIITGSRSDVYRLLQAADVFVFPSMWEGLPGAVLEAQAAGLPCIISDAISREVCLTPMVKQLPLSLSAEQWAQEVLSTQGTQRYDTVEYFRARGFDIQYLVEKLTDFYLKATGDN